MYVVVLVTTPNKKEAKAIASFLVKKGLAACVNVIAGVDSLFKWQGKIDKQKECLLVIKSKKALLPKLIKITKSLHSYSVPEIIALSIIAGNKDYLDWLNESLR
jgi:periplasmic divalent cation tolerance protein